MSKLSKKDREWRRYQRKADREDRRHTRRTEGSIRSQERKRKNNNYISSGFQLPRTISEKKGL